MSKYTTNSVNIFEKVEVFLKYNSDDFHPKWTSLDEFEQIPVRKNSRGKFILVEERFASMVSTKNPPDWAIVLGIVKYEIPATYTEKRRCTIFNPSMKMNRAVTAK